MAADIMTIDEVADYLRINKKTAYRLAADSKLPGDKVGGTRWFCNGALSARRHLGLDQL